MFYVLYRCRLKPGSEEAFRAVWSDITVAIRDGRGGLGSRLHRGDDGQRA
jgi:heme-degrading monooxygenase HmoA